MLWYPWDVYKVLVLKIGGWIGSWSTSKLFRKFQIIFDRMNISLESYQSCEDSNILKMIWIIRVIKVLILSFQALLSCHVTALQDQLVSWFYISVPELQLTLLTVGFQTYSHDSRFSLDFQHPNNYRLRVSGVQYQDKGFYHCQLATHPPQLVWTYLDIVKPLFRKCFK